MATVDMSGESPITGEWMHRITWKHVLHRGLVVVLRIAVSATRIGSNLDVLGRREAHTNPLFKDFNILKFHDKIALESSIFVHKSFKHQLPQPYDSWFGLSSNFHTHIIIIDLFQFGL